LKKALSPNQVEEENGIIWVSFQLVYWKFLGRLN